jgi:hypothetical protein
MTSVSHLPSVWRRTFRMLCMRLNATMTDRSSPAGNVSTSCDCHSESHPPRAEVQCKTPCIGAVARGTVALCLSRPRNTH